MNRRVAFASLLVWFFGFLAPGSPPPAHAAESPWASLLRTDVEAMHRALRENHPGAVDALNKGFAKWLEAGYRQALDRAKSCTSYEGYRFALEAYAAGFKDGHLGAWTELRREEARWPGFMVGWQSDGAKDAKHGGKLVVRVVGEGKEGEGAPPIGSEVVSCDGKPARELLERDVFPFSDGIPELEGGWFWVAPMWLVDGANPWRGRLPQTCKIVDKGVARDHVLRWREIGLATVRAHRDTARQQPKVDFVIRPFGARGVWVGMPGFSPSSETTIAAMKAAIERAPSWRDRDPIVFDVRTNAGGSSQWGDRLLEGLYGKDFVASRIEPAFAREYIEWRVSPANLEHVKTFVAITARVNGAGSPAEKGARSLVAGFARALAEGKSLWRHEPEGEQVRPPFTEALANPVAGRVFLLTDERCASACLDFADRVRALPGAQHVGRTTSADSVYMELRNVRLPSGVAWLSFATKVYRNRPRGNNEPYVPHHTWQGSMADTAALEKWILSLPAAPRER
jgi:hypothetical protein